MLCAISNKYLIENETIKKISNFLYSDYYFLSIVAYVVLMWGLGQLAPGPFVVIGISSLVLVIAGILVLQRDIMPVIPLLFLVMCVMPTPEMPSYIWIEAIFGVIVVAAVVFHVIYYKISEFKFGKLFFPLFLFAIAILLGGVGSRLPVTSTGTLMGFLLIALAPMFIYLMALNYTDPERTTTSYIAKTMVHFGVVSVLELIVFYCLHLDLVRAGDVPHLGWAISNSIATYLLITVPMCFYLYVKKDTKDAYVYLILGIIQYFAIFATTSRGGILFGTAEFIITGIVTIFALKGRKRKEYLFVVAGLVILGIAIFAAAYHRIVRIITHIFSDGMNDSGRFELYREAIACFFEYPIFGVGLGYIGKMVRGAFNSIGIYMFHNTILQYVASLGIVGLVAYAYYYFARIEIIFERWSLYSLYIIMIMIGFEGYSLLNTGTVQGYPTSIILVMLIACYEMDSKQQESEVFFVVRNKLKDRIKSLRTKKVS